MEAVHSIRMMYRSDMKIAKPLLDSLSEIGRIDKAVHLALLHYLDIMEMNPVDADAAECMAEYLEQAASERHCMPIDVAYNMDFEDYVPQNSWINETEYTREQLIYAALRKIEENEEK